MQGKKRKYSDRGNHGQTQSHQGQQANKKPKQRSSMTDLKVKELNPDENGKTFKFASFKDRLKNVRVGTTRISLAGGLRAAHRDDIEEADESRSFFLESVQKWKELNCTTDYTRFARDVEPKSQNLPMVLFNKQVLVDSLLKHLEVEGTTAVDGLMDGLVGLAKDLEEELYPWFPQLLEAMVPFLDSDDAKAVECSFQALALLIKYFSRLLVQDFIETFDRLLPLIGSTKTHVRRFAAEALGFLFRKLDSARLSQFIAHLSHLLHSYPGTTIRDPGYLVADGVAELVAEAVVSVNGTLSSKGEDVLAGLVAEFLLKNTDAMELDSSLGKTNEMPNGAVQVWQFMLLSAFATVFARLQVEGVGDMANFLGKWTDQLAELASSSSSSDNVDGILERTGLLWRICTLFAVSAPDTVHKDAKSWFKKLNTTISNLHLFLDSKTTKCSPTTLECCLMDLSKFGSRLLDSCSITESLLVGAPFLESLFSSPQFSNSTLFAIARMLRQTCASKFQRTALPIVCAKVGKVLASEKTNMGAVLALNDVASSLKERGNEEASRTLVTEEGLLEVSVGVEKALADSVVGFAGSVDKLDEETAATLSLLLSGLVSIQLKTDKSFAALQQLFEAVKPSSDGEQTTRFLLAAQTLDCLRVICVSKKSHDELRRICNVALGAAATNVGAREWRHAGPFLESVASAIEALRQADSSATLDVDLATGYEGLKALICSGDQLVRRGTLRILALLEAMDPAHDSFGVNIFNLCLETEQVAVAVTSIREKSAKLATLEVLQGGNKIDKRFRQVVARFCFGLLGVRFAPLWKDASRILAAYASLDGEAFWTMFSEQIELFGGALSASFDQDASASDAEPTVVADWWDSFGKWQNAVAHSRSFRRLDQKSWESLADFKDLSNSVQRHLREQLAPTPSTMAVSGHYAQAWKMTEGLPQVIERHNKMLVGLVLDTVAKLDALDTAAEGTTAPEPGDSDDEGGDEEKDDDAADQQDSEEEKPATLRGAASDIGYRSNLMLYLSVISKFRNGPGIYKAPTMRKLFLRLLAHPHAPLQKLALECLLTWKSPAITERAGRLIALTEDAKFRETLAAIDLEDWRVGLDPARSREFFEVLTSIMYGKLISRTVRGRSAGALKARRNAIVRFLGSYNDEELQILVDMMAAPFAADSDKLPPMRIQMGFLNLLGVVTNQLRTRIAPFLSTIMPILHRILVRTAGDGEEASPELKAAKRRQKDARNIAMKRITAFFVNGLKGLETYVPELFQVYLDERVAKFQLENVESPSPTLQLLLAWSTSEIYRPLLTSRQALLCTVFETLKLDSVSQRVVTTILDLAANLATEFALLANPTDKHHAVDMLVAGIEHVLSKTPTGREGADVLLKCVGLLSAAAGATQDELLLSRVVSLLLPSLAKPNRVVSERVKADIFAVVGNFVARGPAELKVGGAVKTSQVYRVVSRCFSTIESQAGRAALDACFQSFLAVDPSLSHVAKLVADMNAMSAKRIDEPDFDRRFAAFSSISQELYRNLTSGEWLPLLHNLIFSVRDEKEFSVRTNSAYCIVKLIDRAAELADAKDAGFGDHRDLVVYVLLPAIKQSMKTGSEAVRNEFLGLLAHAVKRLGQEEQFADMSCLIGDGDEDANVFSNLTHMQQHRRTRGMKKLADRAAAGDLRPGTLAQIFFPYFLHVVHEYDRSEEHSLITETIQNLGRMASHLSWSAYHTILRAEIGGVAKRPDREKSQIRLVVALLDSFSYNMTATSVDPAADAPGEADNEDGEEEEAAQLAASAVAQADSAQKIHVAVVNRLLPELYKLLNDKDEDGDADAITLRVPIALAIAGLLVKLPEQSLKEQLPKLLTDLCQRLRSFSQDLRDITRSTLVKITGLLGPSHFLFTVKELKTALTRGPQLHVLAYTVHAIVAAMMSSLRPGDLDNCLEELSGVLKQDLFGTVAEEKDVEELAKKMRETKGTKSYDTFELLASIVSLSHVGHLLRPLREAMEESTQLKATNAVEMSLRRIASGLASNPSINASELLVLVHGMLSDMLPKAATRPARLDPLATPEATAQRNLELNAHMMVVFAELILLSGLRREQVRLDNEDNLRMLDPIVRLLASAVSSKHSGVTVNALKILSILVKTELPAMSALKEQLVQSVFKTLGRTSNLGTELVQQALKFLSTIIRDDDTELSQKQVSYLISMISPELEETSTQSTSFALIKAIVARKFISEEVYDLLDKVAGLLVTSQSSEVRALCRQVWLPFFLDYPQSPERVRKQLNFLVTNLDYVHETGRESAMEMLNVVCRKLPADTLNEYVQLITLALVTKMVADESTKCRQMASELVKTILGRLETPQLEILLNLADAWANSKASDGLKIAAFQLYGILADLAPQLVEPLITDIASLAAASLEVAVAAEATEDDGGLQSWQLAYSALSLLVKLSAKWYTKIAASPSANTLWTAVYESLIHGHAWVRLAASRLVSLRLGALDSAGKDLDVRALFNLAQKCSGQLRSSVLSEEQATQTVKNMFLLAKILRKLGKGLETDEPRNDDERPLPEQFLADPLAWMILKFATNARNQGGNASAFLTRASIFRWFAAIASFVNADIGEEVLLPMIGALYHTTQSETLRGKDAEELKVTAQEVLDLLQNKAGTDRYLQIYNKVHLAAMNKRQARHDTKVTLAVADPEKAAKRKIQRNESKRDAKKRKIEDRKYKKLGSKQKMSLRSRNPEARI